MDISALDSSNLLLALNAAQATLQAPLPAPSTDSLSASASIATPLTSVQGSTDAFGALMQQISPVDTTTNPSTADQSAVATLTNQVLNVSAASTAAETTLLADPFGTLLQQAYLSPLASHIVNNPAQDTSLVADEQARRDVAATTAVSATSAFGNGQTANTTEYNLVPGAAEAMAAANYNGNGAAENYALMQRVLAPVSALGSLDLLA